MKLSVLSVRNRLPDTITEVVKGNKTAKISLRVRDNHVVALIIRKGRRAWPPAEYEGHRSFKAMDIVILTDEVGTV